VPNKVTAPIKLIAMDIDGTLLDSHAELPEANALAITEAAARGIEIVLVTGRRFDFARAVSDALPCELHLIVNNGSLIKSKHGETHQRLLLSSGTALRVLESMLEFRDAAAVVFDRPSGQVVLERVNWDDPFRGSYLRRNRQHIAEMSPLTACLNGEDQVQIGYVGTCPAMRAAKTALEGLPIASEYTLAMTEYEDRNLSILDVLRPGVTKGFALAQWARQRGIERENVMAMGDNWNDREMLEFAGLPVVMGNAIPALKSMGWTVTLSNDENGVAEAIRSYALR